MEILEKLKSCDGSVKFLLKLDDVNTIEILYMHDYRLELTYHSTVCVSTQVGCRIGCMFCASGKNGFERNLSCGEIYEQVEISGKYCKDTGLMPIDAVVFAGMGEPLLNYSNVKKAIYRISRNLGIRNFEIATVGIIPGIYRMIRDFSGSNINIRLNLSLHAATDELREKLIPVTAKYGIDAIVRAVSDYAEAFKTRVRVRYMLFSGLNDTEADAGKITGLFVGKPVKLVISSYNDNCIPGLTAPDENEPIKFCKKVGDRIKCEAFHNFGSDIRGGCGQLRQAGCG